VLSKSPQTSDISSAPVALLGLTEQIQPTATSKPKRPFNTPLILVIALFFGISGIALWKQVEERIRVDRQRSPLAKEPISPPVVSDSSSTEVQIRPSLQDVIDWKRVDAAWIPTATIDKFAELVLPSATWSVTKSEPIPLKIAANHLASAPWITLELSPDNISRMFNSAPIIPAGPKLSRQSLNLTLEHAETHIPFKNYMKDSLATSEASFGNFQSKVCAMFRFCDQSEGAEDYHFVTPEITQIYELYAKKTGTDQEPGTYQADGPQGATQGFWKVRSDRTEYMIYSSQFDVAESQDPNCASQPGCHAFTGVTITLDHGIIQ